MLDSCVSFIEQLELLRREIAFERNALDNSGPVAKQYELEFSAAPLVINPSAQRDLIPLVCAHIFDIRNGMIGFTFDFRFRIQIRDSGLNRIES